MDRIEAQRLGREEAARVVPGVDFEGAVPIARRVFGVETGEFELDFVHAYCSALEERGKMELDRFGRVVRIGSHGWRKARKGDIPAGSALVHPDDVEALRWAGFLGHTHILVSGHPKGRSACSHCSDFEGARNPGTAKHPGRLYEGDRIYIRTMKVKPKAVREKWKLAEVFEVEEVENIEEVGRG